MVLLHACRSAEGALFMEMGLIAHFADQNYNENKDNNDRGGTGRPKADSKFFYLYVVTIRGDLRDGAQHRAVLRRPNLLQE